MASVTETRKIAGTPLELTLSPAPAPAPSSTLVPAAKPAAKRNVGDLTLLSILLMGENGKLAMEALREADKRVVRVFHFIYFRKYYVLFIA